MSIGFKRKLDRKQMRLASALLIAYAITIGADWIIGPYLNPDAIPTFPFFQFYLVAALAIMVFFSFRIAWGAAFLLFSAYAFNEISSLIAIWNRDDAWTMLYDGETLAWYVVCYRIIRLFIDLGVLWFLFQSSYKALRAESADE